MPVRRRWDSRACTKSLPGFDASRRSDIVCFDPASGLDARCIRTIIELKSGSSETQSSIHQLCASRASDIFRVQATRLFVLVSVLHKNNAHVAFFDRGGSIISEPLDFTSTQGWESFVRLIVGFSFARLSHLGYDHNFSGPLTQYLTPPKLDIGSMEILFVPFITDVMYGRGTVVCLANVSNPTKIEEPLRKSLGICVEDHRANHVIIKSNWVDSTTTVTEGSILAILDAKGVQGVPRLLAEETIMDADGQHHISTGYLRDRFGAVATPHHDTYEERTLVRMYTRPWATPVTQFRSALELLGVFYDCITCEYCSSVY